MMRDDLERHVEIAVEEVNTGCCHRDSPRSGGQSGDDGDGAAAEEEEDREILPKAGGHGELGGEPEVHVEVH